MTTVLRVTPEELHEDRARLLSRTTLSWDELRDLAEAYALSADERNIYEGIRAIDFLLAGDAA